MRNYFKEILNVSDWRRIISEYMANPYLIYPDVQNMMNTRETDGSDQSSLMSTHPPDFTDRLLKLGSSPDIDAKCCNVYSLKAGLKEKWIGPHPAFILVRLLPSLTPLINGILWTLVLAVLHPLTGQLLRTGNGLHILPQPHSMCLERAALLLHLQTVYIHVRHPGCVPLSAGINISHKVLCKILWALTLLLVKASQCASRCNAQS